MRVFPIPHGTRYGGVALPSLSSMHGVACHTPHGVSAPCPTFRNQATTRMPAQPCVEALQPPCEAPSPLLATDQFKMLLPTRSDESIVPSSPHVPLPLPTANQLAVAPLPFAVGAGLPVSQQGTPLAALSTCVQC